jgi:hypothetical protein
VDDPAAATSVDDSFMQAGIAGAVALVLGGVVIRLYTQVQGTNNAAMAQLKEAHAVEMARIEAAHHAALERMDAAHKAALERSDAAYQFERARADRMENELREFNKLVTDKLSGELVRASDIVRQTFESTYSERRRQA